MDAYALAQMHANMHSHTYTSIQVHAYSYVCVCECIWACVYACERVHMGGGSDCSPPAPPPPFKRSPRFLSFNFKILNFGVTFTRNTKTSTQNSIFPT